MQVSIFFFHIVYKHAIDSTKDNRNFLTEYHFYICDNQLHSYEFIQYCFKVFCNNLNERDIQMVQYLIWSYNCTR